MQDFSALEGKTLAELREIGKVLGITDTTLRKKELLDKIGYIAEYEGRTKIKEIDFLEGCMK